MKYGLKKEVIKSIKSVLYNFSEVKKAVIYGSRANGKYKTGSDIDLVIYGDDLDLKILHRIENQIDDLFLPYKFDICIYEQIKNPDLLEHIQRVGKILYSSL